MSTLLNLSKMDCTMYLSLWITRSLYFIMQICFSWRLLKYFSRFWLAVILKIYSEICSLDPLKNKFSGISYFGFFRWILFLSCGWSHFRPSRHWWVCFFWFCFPGVFPFRIWTFADPVFLRWFFVFFIFVGRVLFFLGGLLCLRGEGLCFLFPFFSCRWLGRRNCLCRLLRGGELGVPGARSLKVPFGTYVYWRGHGAQEVADLVFYSGVNFCLCGLFKVFFIGLSLVCQFWVLGSVSGVGHLLFWTPDLVWFQWGPWFSFDFSWFFCYHSRCPDFLPDLNLDY